jgi:ketosteroid isomerase-like protein
MSIPEKNTAVVLKIFTALETRDPRRPNPQSVADLFEPDVEFHWPTSLPYGGTSRGVKTDGSTWLETWSPLQPTELERKMDPRVVAVSDEEVVVLWRQRGVSAHGNRFESEVLGLYQIRNSKLARAQMFYFDTAAVVNFLALVKAETT